MWCHECNWPIPPQCRAEPAGGPRPCSPRAAALLLFGLDSHTKGCGGETVGCAPSGPRWWWCRVEVGPRIVGSGGGVVGGWSGSRRRGAIARPAKQGCSRGGRRPGTLPRVPPSSARHRFPPRRHRWLRLLWGGRVLQGVGPREDPPLAETHRRVTKLRSPRAKVRDRLRGEAWSS